MVDDAAIGESQTSFREGWNPDMSLVKKSIDFQGPVTYRITVAPT